MRVKTSSRTRFLKKRYSHHSFLPPHFARAMTSKTIHPFHPSIDREGEKESIYSVAIAVVSRYFSRFGPSIRLCYAFGPRALYNIKFAFVVSFTCFAGWLAHRIEPNTNKVPEVI
jgi:hypothetical protein